MTGTRRRPKDIGTDAEREVLRACQRANIPAHRTALAGSQDQGDIHLHGGAVVIEVKGGAQTRQVSWGQLRAWWAETVTEGSRVPACDTHLLVTRRWGSGQAEDWPAYIDPTALALLLGATLTPHALETAPPEPVAIRLGTLLPLLTHPRKEPTT